MQRSASKKTQPIRNAAVTLDMIRDKEYTIELHTKACPNMMEGQKSVSLSCRIDLTTSKNFYQVRVNGAPVFGSFNLSLALAYYNNDYNF